MRIKFLSGPQAGKFDHAPRSQQTDLLIKAGLVEVVPDEPQAPATVSWGTKFDTFGNPMLVGNCSRGCGFHRFLGSPDNAARYPFQHACGATPTPVPSDIVAQYKRAYDGATPSSTGDDQKLHNARQIPGVIDRNADASFQRLYGRPRRG